MSASVTKSVGSNKSPTKRFTNGHVCFVAAQQKAFQELLKKEFQKKERFDANKMDLTMPRNPLIGEPTPREGEGRPCIDTYWPESESPRKARKDVTLKIGIDMKKYEWGSNNNSPSKGKLASAGRASLAGTPAATTPAAADNWDHSGQDEELAAVSPSRLSLSLSPSRGAGTGASGRQPRTAATPLLEKARTPGRLSNSKGSALGLSGFEEAVEEGVRIKNVVKKSDDWESQGNDFYFVVN
jgi:hypothetical protein